MRISEEKIKKIKESILAFLYEENPKAYFTAEIARETIRDEEFTKRLLYELEKANFVVKITKNPKGVNYSRRERWRLSSQAYTAYSSLN